MKMKLLQGIFVLLLQSAFLFAQHSDDDIIMTIGDEQITRGEFERIFKKNNQDSEITKEALDEYLDLFIKFKLKVLEAERLGLDTVSTFIKELNGYRDQLVKPYFTDESVIDSLLNQAYERLKTEIQVSHILIRLDENAAPEDTAEAYKRIMKIRRRILDGENFGLVARETSEDPSAQRNNGMIGYITAFETVFPFEEAVYNMEPGSISMPVRTRFGYHLIKVHDIRKSLGKVKVAHIMIAIPRDASEERAKQAKDTIDIVYEKVLSGEDFGELAKQYSIDKNSAVNGGELPWFGKGRMVPEFERASFTLEKKGDVSKPVKTAFGWHIIKLIDKKGLESFEELKSNLSSKLKRDDRANLSQKVVVQRLKNEYSYEQLQDLDLMYNLSDTSIFSGNWKIPENKKLDKKLFSFSDRTFTYHDFAEFLASQNKSKPIPVKTYIQKKFDEFVENKIVEYEESKLEEKYPDFRYLMQEYHDGILLFNLTDSMVWSRAVQDTTGLKQFYKDNKDDYMWEDRLKAIIFNYSDESLEKDLIKNLSKKQRKGYTVEEVIEKCKPDEGQKIEVLEDTLFSEGINDLVDKIFTLDKNGKIEEYPFVKSFPGDKKVVYVVRKIPPQHKKIDEARGIITADYQNYLENKWIDNLKSRYEIEVNKDVLYSIK